MNERPGPADSVAGWDPAPFEVTDEITPGPVTALAGLFDLAAPAGPLPPLWHWLYFLDRPAQHDLGPDGHPLAGGFMPPIPDRRRMFAGGRWTAQAPLRVGDVVTRRSSLAAVTPKRGRSGELLFTTVRHEFRRDGRTVGVEEQDIVYRSGPGFTPSAVKRPVEPEPGPWRIDVTADPVLLFRFSALTYNAHRIHYDRPYATEVEGHSGLVVHGPLLALLLAELPRRAGRSVTALEFRARAPLYDRQPFTATGGPGTDLRVIGPGGVTAMTMNVTTSS
ncbi:MaoC family dehydratase N-terminal domain-containing protein [Actinomadura sp. HBU206391]|uniref:FAS1-like dehydratase domain-containing protein n=1 Tax=Actinomadura sp. HBU206391 TaxID=2731692 RepID=UPI00165041DF|nr:MaoC family dehydratase N-terminal domain-containing protein [Actinomadura sp. HBU206391]MBC6459480.1 MaoC family dehydratase N-terminal domain-containing protein [Actinomadura sp. HBU206391]